MHSHVRIRRGLVTVLLFAAVVLLAAGRAHAQINPIWDHYKAYLALNHPVHNEQVTLRDQFQVTTHVTQYLDWFSNPVEKRHGGLLYPIHRPELHYAWWQLGPETPFSRDLVINNQFGEQSIHVDRAVYLLNPANKNMPTGTPLPVANHYKCYYCTGQSVDTLVTLTDQFFRRDALVLQPRFFCTPVEKRLANGLISPIIDPDQHYVVYDMDYTTQIWPVTFADQFVPFGQLELSIDRLLLVPTDKSEPTPAAPSTWGRLKSQYR